MEAKTYNKKQLETATKTAVVLASLTEGQRDAAIMMLNAFTAGMEAQERLAGMAKGNPASG